MKMLGKSGKYKDIARKNKAKKLDHQMTRTKEKRECEKSLTLE